jgi:hypothetical protein
MNRLLKSTAIAGFVALAACGGKGDDALGDNVAQAYENQAEVLDAAAENTSGAQEDALEGQAEALREEGERKEEAIDGADVDATAINSATVNAM